MPPPPPAQEGSLALPRPWLQPLVLSSSPREAGPRARAGLALGTAGAALRRVGGPSCEPARGLTCPPLLEPSCRLGCQPRPAVAMGCRDPASLATPRPRHTPSGLGRGPSPAGRVRGQPCRLGWLFKAVASLTGMRRRQTDQGFEEDSPHVKSLGNAEERRAS